MARHSPQFLELARRGAELQLRDLVQEIRYLMDLFPHLQDSLHEDDLPVQFIIDRGAAGTAKTGVERPGRRRGRGPGEAPKGGARGGKKDWAARRETPRSQP